MPCQPFYQIYEQSRFTLPTRPTLLHLYTPWSSSKSTEIYDSLKMSHQYSTLTLSPLLSFRPTNPTLIHFHNDSDTLRIIPFTSQSQPFPLLPPWQPRQTEPPCYCRKISQLFMPSPPACSDHLLICPTDNSRLLRVITIVRSSWRCAVTAGWVCNGLFGLWPSVWDVVNRECLLRFIHHSKYREFLTYKNGMFLTGSHNVKIL